MKNVLLIGVVVLALSYLGKGQAAKRLRALLTGVKFNAGALLLEFEFQNPSSAVINVRSVVGSVYLNGADIANVSNFTHQRIEGNSASRITVTVRPSVMGVLQFLANAVKTKLAATVAFRGDINADGLIIPVSQSAKLI